MWMNAGVARAPDGGAALDGFGEERAKGRAVLLVRREGQTFFGTATAERRLAPTA